MPLSGFQVATQLQLSRNTFPRMGTGIEEKKKSLVKNYPFFFKYLLEENVGEGNGNPLQYSCLENPMDGGAW